MDNTAPHQKKKKTERGERLCRKNETCKRKKKDNKRLNKISIGTIDDNDRYFFLFSYQGKKVCVAILERATVPRRIRVTHGHSISGFRAGGRKKENTRLSCSSFFLFFSSPPRRIQKYLSNIYMCLGIYKYTHTSIDMCVGQFLSFLFFGFVYVFFFYLR